MIGSLSSCDYYRNAFVHGGAAKEFMNDLMHKDYDKCVDLMDGKMAATSGARDTLKSNLNQFHDRIAKDFGDDPSFSYLRAQKKSTMTMSYIPNTTTVFLQISNDKDLDVIEVLFNDKTGKLMNIKSRDMKAAIPDMGNFWFFGICTLGVFLFNIYMLRRVKRSDMVKKWQKYLAIILLNAPTIGYAQVSGVILMYRIQLFFGVNFIKMGYPSSAWMFGIPLGSLYILWQLKTGKYEKALKPGKGTQSAKVTK
jgi:hypothetical protein